MIGYLFIGFVICLLWEKPLRNIGVFLFWPLALIAVLYLAFKEDHYNDI